MNSKTKKVEVWREKATKITMFVEDWEGSIREWQEAYFTILSHKNAYSEFLSVDIISTNKHEAVVKILIKGDEPIWDVESIVKWLEGLGYKNIQKTEITLGVVEETDIWDDDIDEIVID